MLKVKFDLPTIITPYIDHIWNIFCQYVGIETLTVQENQDLLIGVNKDSDLSISKVFIQNLNEKKYHFKDYFKEKPLILHENGEPDYLGSCFYMLNCVQEYGGTDRDTIGRFPYKESFQHHFNCPEENLVNQYFEKLYQKLPIVQKQGKLPDNPSFISLSHDIDSLYESFLQDGFASLKKGRVDWIAKLCWNELRQNPAGFNIETIMDLEEEYQMKSIFFWLVNKGKSKNIVGQSIKNSDYNINNKRVQETIKKVAIRNFENGLHKSISVENYQQEAAKIGEQIISNRNHYLCFSIPQHFEDIENGNLKIDYSLGFAEVMGFRNGYTLPVRLYDLKRQKINEFLSVPLHIMDTSFRIYQKKSLVETQEQVLAFMQRYKKNTVLGVLWHNMYFTDIKFRGYKEIYTKILELAQKNGIKSLLSKDVLKKYQIQIRKS